MFPEARMQMISTVINPKGNRRDSEFSRCEEYIFIVYNGTANITSNGSNMLKESDDDVKQEDKSVRLRALLRQASNHGKRTDRPNLFYPLLFNGKTGKFIKFERISLNTYMALAHKEDDTIYFITDKPYIFVGQ